MKRKYVVPVGCLVLHKTYESLFPSSPEGIVLKQCRDPESACLADHVGTHSYQTSSRVVLQPGVVV